MSAFTEEQPTTLTPLHLRHRRELQRKVRERRRLACIGALCLVGLVTIAVVTLALRPSSHEHTKTAAEISANLKRASKINVSFTSANLSVQGTLSSLESIPSSMLAAYQQAAVKTNVPWQLLAAIGKNESDNNLSEEQGVHSGVNTNGCCAGPAQICVKMSCGETWQHFSLPGANIYDPKDAFVAAGRYLISLSHIVGNNLGLLLAAYNAGPGAVLKYGGVPPYPETEAYVENGLSLAYNLGLR